MLTVTHYSFMQNQLSGGKRRYHESNKHVGLCDTSDESYYHSETLDNIFIWNL